MEAIARPQAEMSSFIVAAILAVLPNLAQEIMTKFVDQLVEIGVEVADDLKSVTAVDIENLLKPIQLRKLLAAWSGK